MKHDDVLFFLDEAEQVRFEVEDSFRGIAFTGRPQAGKTRFGIHAAFVAMCRKQFGFLCACPKGDTAAQFLKWAREAGRERDVVIVNPDGENLFDLLSWLATRFEGPAMIKEAVLMLSEVGELFGRSKMTRMSGDNKFFSEMADRVNYAVMTIDLAAHKTISADRCLAAIQSLNKEPNR